MATYFVTGANRGIGLAFVRQLAGRGEKVWAGCREPGAADELNAVAGEVTVVELDVADEASVAAACGEVGEVGEVDVVLNNAGTYGPRGEHNQRLKDVTGEAANEVFMTNVAGPLLVVKHLRRKLRPGAKVANISSGYGSIGHSSAGWPLLYCASKAALNMAGAILAEDLREEGVVVVSLSPGWVRTDMGGEDANLSPEESVSQMLKTIDAADVRCSSGHFYGLDGKKLPW